MTMSFIGRLRDGLKKTRANFTERLDSLLAGSDQVDDDFLEEIETLLLTSDFGVETTESILEETWERFKQFQGQLTGHYRIALEDVIRARLKAPQREETPLDADRPRVILIVGVNGAGKTTTIGKLAAMYRQRGEKIMLAAGDTFRAAAVEQLQKWGERSGCPVIAPAGKADSASVLYNAFNAARAQGMDRLIADTAGRLHTKVNLMEELKKIKRVLSRKNPDAPHEIWLVLDATSGQNVVNQVRHFHDALDLTGLVLTKLDGTAKGGVVVGIGESMHLPIRYIGVGEGIDDLKPFQADPFVDALFSR